MQYRLTHFILTSLAASLLLSFQALGVWWEASGSAPIMDGDIEKARERATAEAFQNASLYAGVSIQSQQTIKNGVLEEDRWSFQSSKQIRQTQVIAEKREGKMLTVTIRADIYTEPGCPESQFSHTLTIARFPLAHRQQASHGNIYELGGATSKVLHGLFQENSDAISSHLWLNEVVGYQPDRLTPQPEVDALARTLARRTNSQFILLGHIRDISVSQQEEVNLKFWSHPVKPRALSLEVDLFDGISGERMKRFHYQDRVGWEFSPSQSVDPYSADFWHSNYGKSWGYLLEKVQRDVEHQLTCQPAVAQISSLREPGIVINMGHQDGVKQGQKARLSRIGTFLDPFGRVKTAIQASNVELEVQTVEARQALLVPKEPADMAGIQNQDVVVFQPK